MSQVRQRLRYRFPRRNYVLAFASFARNISLDIVRPARRRHYLTSWLRENYRFMSRYGTAQPVEFFHLFPAARKYVISLDHQWRGPNISPNEAFYLACIARAIEATTVFEFGTYDGGTALALARNVPGCTVHTINLPRTDVTVGGRYQGTPEAARIVQYIGDTRTFDPGELAGTIDLVFIDAGHDYEHVASDTRLALQLLRPGGVIVWDDYLSYPGVRRAVDDFARTHTVYALDKTRMAIATDVRVKIANPSIH